MLYVVELELTAVDRQAEWDAWYMHHLHILLSVPGFRTAQRFRCESPWPSPWLAIYSIDDADVMTSDAYRNRGGRGSTGDWQPLMVNWHRNLFAGVDVAPAVRSDERLLVSEAPVADVAGPGVTWRALTSCGLDRSIGDRLIAIAPAGQATAVVGANAGRVRAYRPIIDRLIAPHGLKA